MRFLLDFDRRTDDSRLGLIDLTLRTLLQRAPEGIARLVLGVELEILDSLSPDTRVHGRPIDHLRRVRRGTEEALLVFHVQSEKDHDLGHEMFASFAQVAALHGFIPVYPIAVVVTPTNGSRPEGPIAFQAFGREFGNFEFAAFRVYELEAAAALTMGLPGLLPLIPLMRGADESSIADASRRLEAALLPPQVHADLQAVLILLGSVVWGLSAIPTHLAKEVIVDSPLYQTIVEESRRDALRDALLAALERKLAGEIPEVVRERVFALASVQLKAMLLDVGDAGSPSAVRRVLGQGLNLEG